MTRAQDEMAIPNMLTHADAGADIPAGDALWNVIRAEALDLARCEPAMRPLLEEQVIDPSDGNEILARVICARLAVAQVDRGMLLELFSGVMEHHPEVLRSTEADITAVRERDPAYATCLHALMNLKGFHAVQTYRIAHCLWNEDRREIALWLSNLASLVFGPDIHPAARIGSSIMLDHGSGIVIGETAVVEDDVSILQNVTLGGTGKETGDRHPKVRKGVMIGAGAKILGNIEIGAYSKVAAGSVVLKSVPPHATVAGVPAEVVRLHRQDEIPARSMDQSI